MLFFSLGCGKSTRAGDPKAAGAGDAGGKGDTGQGRDANSASLDTKACNLTPVVAPTLPDVIPGYLELDPATGLHITGEYRVIDLASYRLKITGKVDHPLDLSYDDLRCLPRKTLKHTIVCEGFFEDTANFSGVTLPTLLDLAGVQADADFLVLKGADDYSASLPIELARFEDNLIAYQWEGQTLPILHGFPARALLPQMPGSAAVKWLLEIEATTAE
jgi:DMSO/TMAO reductase YedYZ molybdopterin-dependent catalytic subunit